MAQLKDDCFAFGGELMPVTDALALLRERITIVVDPETVELRSALGRILSADIIADRSVPPHDNSAVDGYAVLFEDMKADGDTRMPVTGRVAAGHPLDRPVRRGEAVRIFTGAPMPDGMETFPAVARQLREFDLLEDPDAWRNDPNAQPQWTED